MKNTRLTNIRNRQAIGRSLCFVLFGTLVGWLGGSALGAINLFRIHFCYERVLELNQLHGFLQIYGFILPIVFGIALRLFPPSLFTAQATLELFLLFGWVLSVILYVTAWLLSYFTDSFDGQHLILMSDTFIILSAFTFVLIIGTGILQKGFPEEIISRISLLAFIFLPIAISAHFAGTLARFAGRNLSTSFYVAETNVLLFGFFPLLVFVVLSRMGPRLLGVRPLTNRFKKMPIFIALGTLFLCIEGFQGILSASFAFVVGSLLWSTPVLIMGGKWIRHHRPSADAGAARGVRWSLTWLMMSAAMLLVTGVGYPWMGEPHQLILDGARHALTIGFLVQLIFTMLRFLFSAFLHIPLGFIRTQKIGHLLLNLSVFLRLFQVPAAFCGAWALKVSAFSGFLTWVAIGILTLTLAPAFQRIPALLMANETKA